MPHGGECSISGGGNVFDNDYNAVSNGIPAEFWWNSNGIHGIPSGIIPGGSGIPTISIGIPWKKVGISMEMEPQMAEAPAKCFPSKFHGIPQNADFPLGIRRNLQELMEESKDLLMSLIHLNAGLHS